MVYLGKLHLGKIALSHRFELHHRIEITQSSQEVSAGVGRNSAQHSVDLSFRDKAIQSHA
jgi:hypothetical protein